MQSVQTGVTCAPHFILCAPNGGPVRSCDREHALVFPVFNWRLVIKRVAWFFLLCFLNFLCSALSVALLPCFLSYPFVRWFTLFSDAAFLVLCHPVLYCVFWTLPVLRIRSQGRSSSLLNEASSQFPSSAATGSSKYNGNAWYGARAIKFASSAFSRACRITSRLRSFPRVFFSRCKLTFYDLAVPCEYMLHIYFHIFDWFQRSIVV